MNSQLPGNHTSYKNHRRQFWLQIFLPMLVTILIIIAVAVLTGLAAFGENGDSPRWAAISTIWLVIPVMIFGLVFLAILAGLIYLLARGLKVIPPYSSKAQYYVNRATSEVQRFSDMASKPVLFIEGIKASLKAFFGRN
jgi:FtsH-binding integral membrane protein